MTDRIAPAWLALGVLLAACGAPRGRQPEPPGDGGSVPNGSRLIPPVQTVDSSTLTGKVMFGYQGWHATPGDGSLFDTWWHWFTSNTSDAAHLTVDMWPDTRE